MSLRLACAAAAYAEKISSAAGPGECDRDLRRAEHRQHDREHATLAERALHLDATAVRLDDVLGNRQAEARALHLAREPIVDAIELLEDALVLALRDADAVVLHG